MSKIRELEAVLGAGARNNKYRVIFPYFGRELDIQTHDVTAPGRSIGVSEVFLKGRKYQLAGDRSDEGSITLTFYNDPDMLIRRFFLQMIAGMQSYELPVTIESEKSYSSYSSSGGSIVSRLGQKLKVAFNEIRNNFRAVEEMLTYLNANSKKDYDVDLSRRHSNKGAGFYIHAPWYQTDIRIQQLDHNEDVTTEAIYHSSFISEVSGIDYQDEVGEISTTTLTLSYSGVSYGDDSINAIGLTRT